MIGAIGRLGLRIRVKVTNVPKLIKKLEEIDRKVAKKALRQGINEASKPVLKAAKAKVPTETKTLKKSLGRKVKSYRGNLTVIAVVGPRKDAKGKPIKMKRAVVTKSGRRTYRNPSKYAHLAEKGTRRHSLAKGARLARRDRKTKAVGQKSGAQHPGAKAKPFIRPAARSTKTTVKTIIVRTLQAALRNTRRK